MNGNPKTVNERRLGERICYLKKRQAYGELVDYLKAALASGGMHPELHTKACNEMALHSWISMMTFAEEISFYLREKYPIGSFGTKCS